jgi:hypothetical protein
VADEITLTVPREKPFFRVAHLVIGGLAVRLDLTFDTLEDLQVALAGLLSREEDAEGDVTVAVRVLPDAIQATIGPFEPEALRREWELDGELGLRRILDTVCDGATIVDRDGAQWVELTKNFKAMAA